MTLDLDLSLARSALTDRPLSGFADVVTAEGVVERCAARSASAKAGLIKSPPGPPPPPIVPD